MKSKLDHWALSGIEVLAEQKSKCAGQAGTEHQVHEQEIYAAAMAKDLAGTVTTSRKRTELRKI
jgi:hypothetical protein